MILYPAVGVGCPKKMSLRELPEDQLRHCSGLYLSEIYGVSEYSKNSECELTVPRNCLRFHFWRGGGSQ